MKRVGVAELKNSLSRLLRAVEAGETLEVMDRARPIARIVPAAAAPKPTVTIRSAARPFASIRDKVYPPMDPPVDAVALLLADRARRVAPGEGP